MSNGTWRFFLFSLTAEITLFLYIEYGQVSIAEQKIIMENEGIGSGRKV